MKKILLIISALIAASTLSARTNLSLNQGTMQLGGTVQMPIVILKGHPTHLGLHIAPSWDYFVAKRFSLGISPSIRRASLTGDNIPWHFSVSARATYYFDLGGAVYPYLGAGAGIEWATRTKGVNFQVDAPVGILVPLNNRIGIDFGVPLAFHFNSDGFLGAELPIGYFGIRAFL